MGNRVDEASVVCSLLFWVFGATNRISVDFLIFFFGWSSEASEVN